MMSSVAKFHGVTHQSKKVINGQRPSPLMINRDSHFIRKSSSSSISAVQGAETKPHQQQKQRNTIIIYTHSPKVIHTKARDFMALVQKLTGMSPPNEDVPTTTLSLQSHQPQDDASENFGSSLSDGSNNSIKQQQCKQGACDNDETSSALRNYGKDVEVQLSPSSNLGFADMPLFTPNSADFFCSSRPVYKYSDSPYGVLGSLISPSGLEFIKELPEY